MWLNSTLQKLFARVELGHTVDVGIAYYAESYILQTKFYSFPLSTEIRKGMYSTVFPSWQQSSPMNDSSTTSPNTDMPPTKHTPGLII
jgi:hypothetical protein